MNPRTFRELMPAKIEAAHTGHPIGGKRNDAILDKLCMRPGRTVTSFRKRQIQGECTLNANDVRQLIHDQYGKQCPYFPRELLILGNFEFDHMDPILRGGVGSADNIEMISKRANRIKGALTRDEFMELVFVVNKWEKRGRLWVFEKLKAW